MSYVIVQLNSQDLKIKYISISFWLSSLKHVLCSYTMQADPPHASFPQRTEVILKILNRSIFLFNLVFRVQQQAVELKFYSCLFGVLVYEENIEQ